MHRITLVGVGVAAIVGIKVLVEALLSFKDCWTEVWEWGIKELAREKGVGEGEKVAVDGGVTCNK